MAKNKPKMTDHPTEIVWSKRTGRHYWPLNEVTVNVDDPTHGKMQLRRRMIGGGLFVSLDDRQEIYILPANAILDSLMVILDNEKKGEEA